MNSFFTQQFSLNNTWKLHFQTELCRYHNIETFSIHNYFYYFWKFLILFLFWTILNIQQLTGTFWTSPDDVMICWYTCVCCCTAGCVCATGCCCCCCGGWICITCACWFACCWICKCSFVNISCCKCCLTLNI